LETTKPSRPRKAKRKPAPKVSKPIPQDTEGNKYAKPTSMVGEPLLGREQEFVTHVGLGNLKVTTANGLKGEEDDGNTDI
jgi:hypothetical protein